MKQEPEQEKCGITHYAGCACHEKGWENKWETAIEMAAQASVERDEYRRIAGELVAAIRINTMRGTFATATIEDVDQWLKQWTETCGPNADVDLPDTAAQDSASKTNSPAVSG
jgi:hypothetical protein